LVHGCLPLADLASVVLVIYVGHAASLGTLLGLRHLIQSTLMRINTLSEYTSLSGAARRIGVSAQAVDGAARRGRLSYVVTPLGQIFPIEAVEEYAAERETRLRGREL
jgi:hypothetical protein